jgi:hypothetical protein
MTIPYGTWSLKITGDGEFNHRSTEVGFGPMILQERSDVGSYPTERGELEGHVERVEVERDGPWAERVRAGLVCRGLEDVGEGVEERDVKVVCLTDGLEEAGGGGGGGHGVGKVGSSTFRMFG